MALNNLLEFLKKKCFNYQKELKQLSTNFHTVTVNLKHGARCRKHNTEQLKTEVNTLTRSNKGWQGDIVCISEGGGDTRWSRAAKKTH